MSTYVLVHGAWHGGWCWHKIVPRLRAEGHTVVAPDMPGHGHDSRPIAPVTLDDIVGQIHETIDAQDEPVILVGHSYGGAMITQAAEQRSDKIKSLVYVTAFLLDQGQSVMNLAEQDSDSRLTGQVDVSPKGDTMTVKPQVVRDCFYAQCSDEDVAYSLPRLGPEAISGLRTPMQTSAESFGRLPRYYVECLKDNAISPSLQKKLYTALPCERVFSLDTDHSPFFSAPDALARILTSVG
jgi:pimeloyl-ACP methyl ester carboxylesterase